MRMMLMVAITMPILTDLMMLTDDGWAKVRMMKTRKKREKGNRTKGASKHSNSSRSPLLDIFISRENPDLLPVPTEIPVCRNQLCI
jgi:hypothetical protein